MIINTNYPFNLITVSWELVCFVLSLEHCQRAGRHGYRCDGLWHKMVSVNSIFCSGVLIMSRHWQAFWQTPWRRSVGTRRRWSVLHSFTSTQVLHRRPSHRWCALINIYFFVLMHHFVKFLFSYLLLFIFLVGVLLSRKCRHFSVGSIK